jgi:hypothetical protein
MRDPDLMQRADRAAIGLEQAWERWRAMHGLGGEPLPPVSSYVGYSLEEPWGQPRVVFGLRADEAEMLASLLDGHDCVGSVYTEVDARLDWRLPPAGGQAPMPARGYGGSLGVPAQAPPPGIDLLPPDPPEGFAAGRLSDEDATSAEPDEDTGRRQAAPRAASPGSTRTRATRAARPDQTRRGTPEMADESADTAEDDAEDDEASWSALASDVAPEDLAAEEEDAAPDAPEAALEPLPDERGPRSRSAEAAGEPAPRAARASRAKAAAGRGPGYRGPRYQGFPPRYDPGPRAESSAGPAALADDGDDGEAAADGAPGRRSHASKLSRSARRRTQSG